MAATVPSSASGPSAEEMAIVMAELKRLKAENEKLRNQVHHRDGGHYLNQGAGFTLEDEDIRAAFDEFDDDNNGTIYMDEYQARMEKLNVPAAMAKQITKQAFAKELKIGRIKSIEDGLTYEVFVHYIREYEGKVLDHFDQIDSDNNGFIDKKEWDKFMQSYGVSKDDGDKLFKKLDVDENHVIEIHEFFQWMIPTPELEMSDLLMHSVTVPVTVPKSTSFQTQMASGLIAGCVSRTCTAPFDRSRGMMASGELVVRGFCKHMGDPNNSVSTALRAMYAEGTPVVNGLSRMWRGNLLNCAQVGPEWALLFALNGAIKPRLCNNPSKPTAAEGFVSGALAGGLSLTAVYPFYVVQTRMLVAPSGHFNGILHAFKRTIQEDGVFNGLYKPGYDASIMRILPSRGISLTTMMMCKQHFVPEGQAPTIPETLAFGTLASITSETLTHPLRLAAINLQTQGVAGRPIQYSGVFDCLRQQWASGTSAGKGFMGGCRTLMAGWSGNMMKNIPANAITFAVADQVVRVLRPHHTS